MSFRDNLREALDFMDMEQKELSAKTGLSLKTIENYVKKDSSIPSADKAVLIAQALGVTVEYLVTGKKTLKNDIANIYYKHEEIINVLAKLNDYNYKVIASMAKAILELQTVKKSGKKG